jgi:hypothetical protein
MKATLTGCLLMAALCAIPLLSPGTTAPADAQYGLYSSCGGGGGGLQAAPFADCSGGGLQSVGYSSCSGGGGGGLQSLGYYHAPSYAMPSYAPAYYSSPYSGGSACPGGVCPVPGGGLTYYQPSYVAPVRYVYSAPPVVYSRPVVYSVPRTRPFFSFGMSIGQAKPATYGPEVVVKQREAAKVAEKPKAEGLPEGYVLYQLTQAGCVGCMKDAAAAKAEGVPVVQVYIDGPHADEKEAKRLWKDSPVLLDSTPAYVLTYRDKPISWVAKNYSDAGGSAAWTAFKAKVARFETAWAKAESAATPAVAAKDE